MTVGIRIPDTPVKGIAGEGVLAGKLTVICSSTAVVILSTSLQVRLCAHTVTPGISACSQLVEDVLELVLVVAVLGEEGEVEHGSESDIIIILVVDRMTQVVGLVVSCIVDTKEVVLHLLVGAIFIGVVQCGKHAECSASQHPSVVQAGCQLQVAQGLLALYHPVVVQVVAQEGCGIVVYRAAVGIELRSQGGIDTSVNVPHPVVESQEVGCRTFRVSKVLEG